MVAAAPALHAAHGGGSLLLDSIMDDTLLHIATFLTAAKELLCLQLTCSRFATKCIAAPSSGGLGAAAAPEMLSLVEEAARRWLAGCSEQERGWVRRRASESFLGLMYEVEGLRLPLFGRRHTNITLSSHGITGEQGSVATNYAQWVTEDEWEHRTAASKAVMRAGRHCGLRAIRPA
jgi:hypothetical protein